LRWESFSIQEYDQIEKWIIDMIWDINTGQLANCIWLAYDRTLNLFWACMAFTFKSDSYCIIYVLTLRANRSVMSANNARTLSFCWLPPSGNHHAGVVVTTRSIAELIKYFVLDRRTRWSQSPNLARWGRQPPIFSQEVG